MARSNQKAITRLNKEFKTVFCEPVKVLNDKLDLAISAKFSEVYNISITQYMNNCWNVYMMYSTCQKVIPMELTCVKANVDAWINEVVISAGLLVQRVEEEVERKALVDKFAIVEEWLRLDMDKGYRKLKRLKSQEARKEDISVQEREMRRMRKDIWDLEDELKAHLGKDTMKGAVAPFQTFFPLACSAAILHSENLAA